MKTRIYISDIDARKIRKLLDNAPRVDARLRGYMEQLEIELNRAKIVSHDKLPAEVISVNSVVELEDLADGELLRYTLVFPEEADATEGKISILAPLGTGMLGYKKGDTFEWTTPGGLMKWKVCEVTHRPQSEINPILAN